MYGIKDGRYGLFPSDFVERMSPQTIRREMRVITKVTRSSYRDQYNDQYNEANNNNNLENGNNIGKKHALKKYDQFTQNTSCFWGCITPVVQFHEILCYKNNE